jgi:hypothetical protein
MGKIFQNLFKTLLTQKMQIWLEGELMQNPVIKVMVLELFGPELRKVILHVFLWEILAKMTQVSDVAPGPIV